MNIDGRKIADQMLAGLKKEISDFKKPPVLAAVLVGDMGGSRHFLEIKRKAAERAGIAFRMFEFQDDISNKTLRAELNKISKNKNVDGVILELPLPAHLNVQSMLNVIPEEKDADVLSQKAQGAFFAGKSKILPPSVEAVAQIFNEHGIDIKGRRVAVFGYGLLIGRPIAHWLLANGATVFVINEFTPEPGKISILADIIISGVGKPKLIKAGMIKEGAVVIDFGYAALDGKVFGDVAADVSSRASLITPVPGGAGPIVVAAVLKNLVTLIKNVGS